MNKYINHNYNKIVKSDCLSTALILALIGQFNRTVRAITRALKVTRPSFFGRVPSYFEALWYPHLYFYRKSNT